MEKGKHGNSIPLTVRLLLLVLFLCAVVAVLVSNISLNA